MLTRPAVVDIVRNRAVEALNSQNVPDDTTPFVEAVGLIAHAVAVLQKAVGGDAAMNAHGMVDKHVVG